ncbi:unnamed protein product [Pleuronectes platessa]|uniref:Secreted protein n=1 Tax=Pleuronectes platessa TaxID=8262 RepID=A0A9N7UJ52_PLEPL|nr:unnamed protein product [Pleuronectes platessa]
MPLCLYVQLVLLPLLTVHQRLHNMLQPIGPVYDHWTTLQISALLPGLLQSQPQGVPNLHFLSPSLLTKSRSRSLESHHCHQMLKVVCIRAAELGGKITLRRTWR